MANNYGHLKLKFLKEKFKYVCFEGNTPSNEILELIKFSRHPKAIFLSEEELSIIVEESVSLKFEKTKEEAGWTCFCIVGEMPFGSVQGLIASISSALFEKQIGICVISTFKSDWFFIKSKNSDIAAEQLLKKGWNIED